MRNEEMSTGLTLTWVSTIGEDGRARLEAHWTAAPDAPAQAPTPHTVHAA